MLDDSWYNISVETFGNGALCISASAVVIYPYTGYVGKAPLIRWTTRPAERLDSDGKPNEGRFAMSWEVDWAHPENTGTVVMARNPTGHLASSREWHLVTTGHLRKHGINTPTYRKDAWEIDWAKRNGKLVWARNPQSKMPSAREWHWIDVHTIERAGLRWQPRKEQTGRFIDARGYMCLSRRGMTAEEIELADKYGLWLGSKRNRCLEHRLVATKKYGGLPPGTVVRHVNGIKTDNSPNNLVLGTTQENTMDHETARRTAMYWRDKYEEACREIEALRTALERCLG